MRPFSYLRRLSTASEQGLADTQRERARVRSQRLGYLVSILLMFGCAELAAHWGLRLLAGSRAVPAGSLQIGADAVDTLASQGGRLFGTAPTRRVAAPTRYRLYGVIGGGEQAGAALIGVDGQAPQALRVGAEIAPGVRLVSTGFGQVEIEQYGKRSVLGVQPGAAGMPAMRGFGPAAPPGVADRVRELEARRYR